MAEQAKPQICNGCVYLSHSYTKNKGLKYKCDAAGKKTYPQRTACSLYKVVSRA